MKGTKESAVSGKLDTYIGEDTSFEGTLNSKKSLTIYGAVKGKINCQGRVVIGQSGNVTADIVADSVAVSGNVIGNVTAKTKMEIASTGSVNGDIKTSRLITEDGSKFDGHCEMLSTGTGGATNKAKAEDSPPALPAKENPKLPDPSREEKIKS
jgi:cytoskeletal protein CcmA (bactofilin family)